MAYTITFEKEPDKLVYFAGNPIEYLVKVAYGGGDNIPATMVLNFNVVKNGITYNQTITKTVKYFSGNNAFFNNLCVINSSFFIFRICFC